MRFVDRQTDRVINKYPTLSFQELNFSVCNILKTVKPYINPAGIDIIIFMWSQ